MTLREDTKETVRQYLELIVESFRQFPLPGVEIPEPSEWSDFLRKHPQYVDEGPRGVAVILASDRNIIEPLTHNYQKLAGTMIRVLLSDEQLTSIHNGN